MRHRKTVLAHVSALAVLIVTAAAALANQSDLGRLGETDLYQASGEWQAPVHAVNISASQVAFAAPSLVQGDAPAPAPAVARHAVTPTLTVMGNAQLDKPADQMRLTIGIVTEGDDSQAAVQENSRQMNDVIAAMQKAGLAKEEYQTGQFQIHPRYSNPPRGHVDPNWKPQIIGFQVINRVMVKTKKLNVAGDLIKAATDAGANSIDSISFDLADPRKHRAEAIAAATGNARADAEALAGAAGQRLVRILSINLDSAPVQPMPDMRMMGSRMAMAESDVAPPIQPGEITIHASVTIVYEINGQE